MSDSVDVHFAMGSLKFKNFKELYQNINGRSNGFEKECFVMSDGKAVIQFLVKYEKGRNHRFVLELLENDIFILRNSGVIRSISNSLPSFYKVGGGSNGSKYYGYMKIKDLV